MSKQLTDKVIMRGPKELDALGLLHSSESTVDVIKKKKKTKQKFSAGEGFLFKENKQC